MSADIVAVLVVPISGWEGLYEVTSGGEVRRLPTRRARLGRWGLYEYTDAGRVLRQIARADGYRLVTLVDGQRRERRRVHHLVLEAFVGPRPAGMEGCHADGDPSNNALANLRWDTHQGNVADTVRHGRAGNGGLPGGRNPSARLTDEDVAEVRHRLSAGVSHRLIAAAFGVSKGAITKINRGRTWTK